MRVALYSRVSTKGKQDNEIQLKLLREYAESKHWVISGEYADEISGVKQRRPELDRLFVDIDKYDGVLCLRIDRFGRSLKNLIENVQRLRDNKKFFIAVSQGIEVTGNKTDPTNDFLMNILGAAAQFEHELISQRVSDSIQYRQSKHIPLGRKTVLENKGIDYNRIIELRKNGSSIRSISRGLGISRSSVYRYIQSVPKRIATIQIQNH